MVAHSTRTNSLHIAIFIEGCFTVIVVVKFEPVILQICSYRMRRTNRHAHSNTMLPCRAGLCAVLHEECRRDARLPYLGREPVAG